VDQAPLIIETSRLHSGTPHRAELLWMGDQPKQKPLPDNKQQSQETDIRAPNGIRTHNAKERAAADPRFDRAATGVSPMLKTF
jgi:hypothetical protein